MVVTTPPTLVLLPGLDGTESFLRPLIEALSPSCKTTTVCYPESGASDYSEALQFVRSATAGLKEFFVLGLSFSGPLAVKLASEEPTRVKGLILAGTFLRAPRRNLAALGFLCRGPVVSMLRLVNRIPEWILKRSDDRLRQAKAETWARVSSRCMASRIRAILHVDVRESFRECRQPVLSISFSGDRVVPRSNADEIRREAPSATTVSIPGGHFSGCMNGRTLASEIVRFIERIETSRTGSA
jgi:pimeloyl-ACP methyl ester carboxylesterase